MSRLFRGVCKFKHLEIVPGGLLSYNVGPGNTYYVNNQDGSSTADGLSWETACDQPDTAIALAEANRKTKWSYAGVKMAAPYQSERQTIIIQGTSGNATVPGGYTHVTLDLNFADVIGLGAKGTVGDGTGGGVALIQGTTSYDGVSQGLVLGTNWYNVHFAGGGGYPCFDATNLLNYSFEDCYFINNIAAETVACLRVTGDCGGVHIKNCMFGGDAGSPAYGILIYNGVATGATFNQCCIEKCWVYGTTKGMYINSYLADGTVIRDNVFMGGTHGFHDANTNGGVAASAYVVNNRGYGSSAGILCDQIPLKRAMGNLTTNGTNVYWYSTIS